MEIRKRLGRIFGGRLIENSKDSVNSKYTGPFPAFKLSLINRGENHEAKNGMENKNYLDVSGISQSDSLLKKEIGNDFHWRTIDSINQLELLKKNAELMGKTKELESRNRELEDSNNLKDLFIDIIRHDILSPAGVIRSFSELILEDDPGNQDVEIIHKNSIRLIKIIDKANLYSMLEHKRNFESLEMDLKEIIEGVCLDFEPIAENIGFKIQINIAKPMPLKTNPLIREVFVNLLTNAEKYAAKGKTLIIESRNLEDEYLISFTDFGIGIPPEHRETIFNRFQRFHKGPIKGSGLGLAIVKRLVDLHGGSVWVEDNIIEFKENGIPVKRKQGCIFKIKFPKNLPLNEKILN